MKKPYPNLFIQKELCKLCSSYNDYYEIIIDDYCFMLRKFNKYRYSNYCSHRNGEIIEDFTIFIKNVKEIKSNWQGYPCYWFNHDLGRFTIYYTPRDSNDGTKSSNYKHICDDFKSFKKIQKKYINTINNKLILFETLNNSLEVKEEIKKKVVKI